MYKEQFVTTTVLPLGKENKQDAIIKNQQFNSYIHFRTLSGNKNDYDFQTNIRKLTFMSDFIHEKSYLGDNYLVVSLRSVLLKYKMHSTSKYTFVEFFLHLFILSSLYFKVDIFNLPIHLKNAYPIVKFFVIVLLYCLVCCILFIFETWFKLIKFLDFKYA